VPRRRRVQDSGTGRAGIDAGEDWKTYGGGRSAQIRKISYCPAPGCYLTPYITTSPDHTTENNLDNLPLC
jgi:hypothetical protein